MRRLSIILFVLLAGSVLISLHSANRVLAREPRRASHQDFPPRPGGTPVVIGLPNLNPPTATAVPPSAHPQKPTKPAAPPDAVRLALTNPYVKALLKGKAYRVQKVAPWLSGKGKLVVVGFYRAMTVSGTWLAAGKPPYRATYRHVVGLQVYVELTRKTVAAIVPHRGTK